MSDTPDSVVIFSIIFGIVVFVGFAIVFPILWVLPILGLLSYSYIFIVGLLEDREEKRKNNSNEQSS